MNALGVSQLAGWILLREVHTEGKDQRGGLAGGTLAGTASITQSRGGGNGAAPSPTLRAPPT